VRDGLRDVAVLANGDSRRHYVVCGSDSLAYRVVDALARTYRVPVTVILTPWRRGDEPDLAELPGVRIVRVQRVDEAALRAARLESAAALALVQQDDVGNIHAALLAREVNPGVRVVVRMFNMRLGDGIRRLFTEEPPVVLSDAEMAAPEFVAVALGEVDPNTVRLPSRTLYVARRQEVRADDVVCALADTSLPNRPVLLPAEPSRANIVLASVNPNAPAARAAPTKVKVRRRRQSRRPLSTVIRGLRGIVSRKLQLAIFALVGLVFVAGTALELRHPQGIWRTIYTTLITTVAGAAAETGDPWVEALQVVLVLCGVALIPLVTAAIVEGIVNARLAAAQGRLQAPIEDHVIVIGLGNVGTRVIRELYDLRVPVVAIDKNEGARGALLARELGIPLIIGDASLAETLNAASVRTCRALVALSTDDVTNLQAALHGREARSKLRVVLRLFDGQFAERVQHAFNINFSRSVSYLAAPAFAAAMADREVLQIIPIERHVLLIAQVPIGKGSALDGAEVAAANVPGEAEVIAVTPFGEPRPLWTPGPRHRLAHHDRLKIVATREGLNRTLGRAAPAPVAQPAS
jgi:Trk K+ transport system NAD-binding subunit